MRDTKKVEGCFSTKNFIIVYNYIDVQLKKSNTAFFKFNTYELYLIDLSTISLKLNGYTLSNINKAQGVFALAKREKDNDRMLIKTNQILCDLLLAANEAASSE
ncbi:MAG: hypothetical protein GQ574_22850 [Crocinitomix sp.]|nr:hypothetical protein [Crocinitomix sp.]